MITLTITFITAPGLIAPLASRRGTDAYGRGGYDSIEGEDDEL